MDNLQSGIIKVGQINIHYLAGGEGDPLVILHGGGNGSSAWLNNATEISKHYRVYIPDLPGFGHSQSMGDQFSMSEFVGFVEQFALAMGLEDFYLLGHSIGGCIALQYAFKFPQRIKKLVLVSSLCLGKEIALWVRFLSSPFLLKSIGEPVLAILRFIKWAVRLIYAPSESSGFISRLKMSIGKSFTTLKGQAIVLQSRLSELVVPTLLIWGTKDGIVPVSQAYAAVRMIPNGQLHVFEGGGHSPYQKDAIEFSELMARFLK